MKCFVDCDQCQLKASLGKGDDKLSCMFSGRGGGGRRVGSRKKVAEIIEDIRASRRKCKIVVPAVWYFVQRSYIDQTMRG